jgi:hypothetical protein
MYLYVIYMCIYVVLIFVVALFLWYLWEVWVCFWKWYKRIANTILPCFVPQPSTLWSSSCVALFYVIMDLLLKTLKDFPPYSISCAVLGNIKQIVVVQHVFHISISIINTMLLTFCTAIQNSPLFRMANVLEYIWRKRKQITHSANVACSGDC